ncbi:MAG: peptidylprolyl isomerase, partial [Gemmatimonadota bacterium]|nr:peptidylprolyl isomerase [Gemmatimonadota bacterium]
MTRRNRLIPNMALAVCAISIAGCGDVMDGLTSHARPVASVADVDLGVQELGQILAESAAPDSALTGFWAARVARLWADYVLLVRLYQEPDSTESLDYDPLLEAARFYSVLEVQRYRDSVVLAGIEPTDTEVREYFDQVEPLTRLDVRRVSLAVPPDVSEDVRDSLFTLAQVIRQRVAGGADFVEIARQFSDEPAAARGQTIAYQGHGDFAPVADSIVFRLRPGEISPVFSTGDQMVFYRVERRRVPDFESVKDIVKNQMVDRRRFTRLTTASDSLLDGARRSVADGAERTARAVASMAELGSGRFPGSTRLVRYEGGAFTVSELRELFRARPDLQRRFAEEEDDEEIGLMLYQLAGDEILIEAAAASGVELSSAARADLQRGIGRQLAAIARRLNVSHAAAVHPQFDVEAESRRFLASVLEVAEPIPWLTEFRLVLDPVYPSRVDERSAETAARIA